MLFLSSSRLSYDICVKLPFFTGGWECVSGFSCHIDRLCAWLLVSRTPWFSEFGLCRLQCAT